MAVEPWFLQEGFVHELQIAPLPEDLGAPEGDYHRDPSKVQPKKTNVSERFEKNQAQELLP